MRRAALVAGALGWLIAGEATAQDLSAALDAPPEGSTEEVLAPRDAHGHVLSLHLLTLGSDGLALQYEALPTASRLSLVLAGGFRMAAAEDFSSGTLALGAAVRYWPWADTLDDDRQTGGFFFEGRLDVAWTRVTDVVANRVVGHALTFAESAHAGYRFVLFDRMEITPTAGLGLSHQLVPDGHLCAHTSIAITLGATVGVLF